MNEFKTENYGFIIPLQDFKTIFGESCRTNRILSNIIILNENESRRFKKDNSIELILGLREAFENADSILNSQMITPEALDYLNSGQFYDFLRSRSSTMYKNALSLVR